MPVVVVGEFAVALSRRKDKRRRSRNFHKRNTYGKLAKFMTPKAERLPEGLTQDQEFVLRPPKVCKDAHFKVYAGTIDTVTEDLEKNGRNFAYGGAALVTTGLGLLAFDLALKSMAGDGGSSKSSGGGGDVVKSFLDAIARMRGMADDGVCDDVPR
uniref:Uncharacterized protein n=1 Tax=Lotharella oceanica TaxID=641309 RepID=A0A7S2U211_9EUKA|mmetsp:Transcript_6691/g.13271  ORF Transcript_6691/g.13271 Transcript_6691/m.13271 type:complete len:156 (+) Transcript_6691:690-1157(+)